LHRGCGQASTRRKTSKALVWPRVPTNVKKKHWWNYTKQGSQKAWRTSINTDNPDPNTSIW
jgi:hypothetical protein